MCFIRVLFLLLTAATPIAAQQTWVVTLDPSLSPEHAQALDELRRVVRAGGPERVYDAGVGKLRAVHRRVAAPVRAAVLALGGEVEHEYWALGGLAVRLPAGAETQITARSDVVVVEADALLGASIAAQTSSANHAADAVQLLGFTGSGATLALVDSGIDLELGPGGPPHPAFVDAGGASRIVAAVGIADPLDVEDTTGHGTAVAGIAAARDWSALPTTDDGFAPDARIASYKITHDALDNAWSSDWIAAWHAVLADRVRHGIVAAVASYGGSPSPTDPTQRIVDLVAHYGDVLIVSSAGNDGDLPEPAARSQADTNGLAVGSVDGGSHTVSPFSSPGPLPGDPLRTWPDLCAVGSAVFAPAPDNPNGTSLPLSGTSFAAPAVAGTALVLRAAWPELSSTDTKALLLNSAADVSAQNPWLGPLFSGVGMLRTDLAVDHAQNGALHRGTTGAEGSVTAIAIPVQPGVRYAATLAWPRVNVSTADWNDLDLRVRAPDGTLLAVSQSPHNTYERVLFTPASAGDHALEIVATRVLDPAVAWSAVVAPHAAGGAQEGTYELGVATCSGSGSDPAAATVVPPAAAATFANARTSIPFADRPTRTQQAFDGSTVPSGLRVDALAFRLDEEVPGTPGYDVDIEILLGHTLAPPNALSPTFAANWDGPPIQALRSTALHLPAASGVPDGPDDFAFVVPLGQPFTTATSGTRHLLVEISVFSHSRGAQRFGLWLDAVADVGNIGRIWTQGVPFAATGARDPLAPVMALVTAGGPGAGIAPRLDFGGSLALGGCFDVVLRGAPPSAPAALVHGAAMTSPLDLAILGAPGCLLETGIDALLPVAVDGFGRGWLGIGVGTSPALTGLELRQRFVVLDPAANDLGVTTSNGGSGRVGG